MAFLFSLKMQVYKCKTLNGKNNYPPQIIMGQIGDAP